jgi:hypothetical protein
MRAVFLFMFCFEAERLGRTPSMTQAGHWSSSREQFPAIGDLL